MPRPTHQQAFGAALQIGGKALLITNFAAQMEGADRDSPAFRAGIRQSLITLLEAAQVLEAYSAESTAEVIPFPGPGAA